MTSETAPTRDEIEALARRTLDISDELAMRAANPVAAEYGTEIATALRSLARERDTLSERVRVLEEALEAADRALWVHIFQPRGHETSEDRDTCQRCGHSFRHERHVLASEGHPSDVATDASRRARAALGDE